MPELTHRDATLTITSASGAIKTYTPAMLETYPTYALTTKTPWRDRPAEFEGILLRDLLAAHGLDTVDAILVSAENDFSTTIPRSAWEDVDILIATRVDGRAHSRRVRGPIQFVIEWDAYNSSTETSYFHLVWMVNDIKAAS